MVREEQKRAVISDDNTWMYIMQVSAFLVVMLGSRISCSYKNLSRESLYIIRNRMKMLLISSEGA